MGELALGTAGTVQMSGENKNFFGKIVKKIRDGMKTVCVSPTRARVLGCQKEKDWEPSGRGP